MLNSPDWLTRDKPSPFVAGKHSRHLQLIVIDDELDPTPALDLLRVLANRRPLLDVASFTGRYGGHIKIADDQESIDYEFKDGHGPNVFVYGDWWKQAAVEESAEVGLSAEVLERRFLLTHEAGRREWIDGLVMPFPPQLAQRWRNLLAKAPLLTGEQAIALAGLFLRAHGDFTIEIDERPTTIHAGHAQLYRIGSAALLPGIGRWLAAATEHWRATGDPTLDGLADAVLVRFSRALKARDYLQVRRQAPDRQAAWSDVLFFFEAVLVSLQGSLDAAARFLHLKYGLSGSRRHANWGHEKWRESLDASGAPTADFDGRRLWDLDTLVGELRNSIHGEVLSGELRKTVAPGEDPLTMAYGGLALEAALAESVAEAAEREGGAERWLHSIFPEGVGLVDPWQYTEAATDTVAVAVESIIGAVNAEAFAGIEVSPGFEELWIGTPRRRENARMLFGIGAVPGTTRG